MTAVISKEPSVWYRRTMKKLVIYLVKPSRYDDEGYVIRHWPASTA